MKINLCETMKALDGHPLMDKNSQGSVVELTVKMVLLEALLRVHPGDDRLSGMEKMRRFDLAKRIYDTKEYIDISHEEIVLLKESVGLKLPVLIVGQTYRMFDKE